MNIKQYLLWGMLALGGARMPSTLHAAKTKKHTINWGTQLKQAVEDYDIPRIKKLLKKSSITQSDKDAATNKAKEYGYDDVVKLLSS